MTSSSKVHSANRCRAFLCVLIALGLNLHAVAGARPADGPERFTSFFAAGFSSSAIAPCNGPNQRLDKSRPRHAADHPFVAAAAAIPAPDRGHTSLVARNVGFQSSASANPSSGRSPPHPIS